MELIKGEPASPEPEDELRVISVRVPPQVYADLTEAAWKHDMSRSKFVRELISLYLYTARTV